MASRNTLVARICIFYVLIEIGLCSIAMYGKPIIAGVPSRTPESNGVPWPLPSFITMGNETSSSLELDPDTLVITSNSSCSMIKLAIERYKAIIAKENEALMTKADYNDKNDKKAKETAGFKALKIIIDDDSDCDRHPYLDMDESYRLDVSGGGKGVLRSTSVWGALRGLETFSQLIYPAAAAIGRLSAAGSRLRIRADVSIRDKPRFAHRGVLLDTSRHYLSKNVLKQNLDLMAFAKYNVFHWHIVDDPAFPYESSRFPDLSGKGAYSPKHVYNERDIAEIVEYARIRGIRVIPEFDTPAHMLSWGPGVPGLLTECPSGQGYSDNLVDPSRKENFDFLSDLFREVIKQFPDKYVHLGGDEVYFDCWKLNQRVQEMMRALNITSERLLEDHYMQKVFQMLAAEQQQQQQQQIASETGHGGGQLVWQELFDNGVRMRPETTIVQVWKGSYSFMWYLELFKITFYGLRAILSSCWYLNDIAHSSHWKDYYRCDPHSYLLTRRQKSLIIGGEACMWGENIDATNLLPTLWPKASAVAERLWSPARVRNADEATPRIEEHRCRLIRRGYPVSPVNGPGFCHVEWNG